MAPPRSSSSARGAALLVAATLLAATVLDAPWGRAFQDVDPWTERLGRAFFTSLGAQWGVAGLPVSPFELASFVAAALAFAWGPRRLATSGSPAWLAALWAVPAAIAVGVATGLAGGQAVGLAMTQVRALALLPAWLVVGYGLGALPTLRLAYGAVVLGMLAKSAQALWIYARQLGFSRGEREYLVEHATSSLLLTAAGVVVAYALLDRRLLARVFAAGSLALYGAVFLLNDRRAALVGAAVGAALVGAAVPREVRRRYAAHLALGALAAVVVVAATWRAPGVLGFPSRAVLSLFDPDESSIGYRRIENANLLWAIAGRPLTGLGFGRRFPVVFPMPDISSIYAEYDLVPHNTWLFVWTFAGPFGMAAMGTLVAVTIAHACRSLRAAPSRERGLAAALVLFGVGHWLLYAYADLGLREERTLALFGLAVGSLFRGDVGLPAASLARPRGPA
jgi:hypothetical protein